MGLKPSSASICPSTVKGEKAIRFGSKNFVVLNITGKRSPVDTEVMTAAPEGLLSVYEERGEIS